MDVYLQCTTGNKGDQGVTGEPGEKGEKGEKVRFYTLVTELLL